MLWPAFLGVDRVLTGTVVAAQPDRIEQERSSRLRIAETGRLALVAGLVAAGAVLAVGFVVSRAAHHDLLEARATIHQGVVDDLVQQGLIPIDPGNQEVVSDLDAAIRLRLVGGETVRVKLWSPDGEILYSDASQLIGQRFDVDAEVATALAGGTSVTVDDLSEAESITEEALGMSLLEFYLPVVFDGEVVAALEIYEDAASFSSSLADIRNDVWTAVAVGLGALIVAFGSVAIRYARGHDYRRRKAEHHLAEMLTASDDERRRIVGALHDDIGQPLYRIQYGLEGCLRHLEDGEVASEIHRLIAMVGDIDKSLRSELQILHSGLVEGDGLDDALVRLAHATRTEGGLDVEITKGDLPTLSGTAATALFRAAQEAVINARKHAQASKITIDLRRGPGTATVTVSDNGRGWNGRMGIGLATTRQRLAALDGSMLIERSGGRGTRVRLSVPTGRGPS
jgi:two-component system NarL family sensor kinase